MKSEIHEDTHIVIPSIKQEDLVEDLEVTINLGDTGTAEQVTNTLLGFLDCITISIPKLLTYNIEIDNPNYDEQYIRERDVNSSRIWYPRIQPDLPDKLNYAILPATFGVERKFLNEPIRIRINGHKNTVVKFGIRLLKRE